LCGKGAAIWPAPDFISALFTLATLCDGSFPRLIFCMVEQQPILLNGACRSLV
jgi:hypothetical protein